MRAVLSHPTLRLWGVTTHLHTPTTDTDEDYLRWRFARFKTLLNELRAVGLPVPLAMAASSSALQLGTSMVLDAVDPGSLVFGLRAPGPLAIDLRLKPAFSLTSTVIHVKWVEHQEHIDYGVVGARPRRIAVLPIGSYDQVITVEEALAHQGLPPDVVYPLLVRDSVPRRYVSVTR